MAQEMREGPPVRHSVVVPNFEESLQIELLESNLIQTEKYIEQFTNEKETLDLTYNDCQDVVREEFQRLRDMLTEREELLLSQLGERFNARDEKIEGQLNNLQNHAHNNEDTDDKCKQLLGTMTERSEKAERTLQITKLCQDCVKQSPLLQEVPIDLKHKFKTQESLINSIRNYGELIFKRIESGRKRKFKTAKHDVETHEFYVGDKIPASGTSGASGAARARNRGNGRNINSNNFNSKINNLDDEKKMELEQNGGAGIGSDKNNNYNEQGSQLPEKVKIVCTVVANDQTKDKSITLKKAKNDFTLEKIKETIQKVNIVKPIVKELGTDKICFNYWLININNDEQVEICNDDDLIQHIIMSADPDSKICIKAELVTN